jgi:hypothetical protein
VSVLFKVQFRIVRNKVLHSNRPIRDRVLSAFIMGARRPFRRRRSPSSEFRPYVRPATPRYHRGSAATSVGLGSRATLSGPRCRTNTGSYEHRALCQRGHSSCAHCEAIHRAATDKLFAISWPVGDWIVSILSCQLPLQTEGIVDRMRRLGKPAGAGFGDDHMVLEAHAEFAVDANGRLVREGHAGF